MPTQNVTTPKATTTATDTTTDDPCDYHGHCPNGKVCILGFCENISTPITTTSITTPIWTTTVKDTTTTKEEPCYYGHCPSTSEASITDIGITDCYSSKDCGSKEKCWKGFGENIANGNGLLCIRGYGRTYTIRRKNNNMTTGKRMTLKGK